MRDSFLIKNIAKATVVLISDYCSIEKKFYQIYLYALYSFGNEKGRDILSPETVIYFPIFATGNGSISKKYNVLFSSFQRKVKLRVFLFERVSVCSSVDELLCPQSAEVDTKIEKNSTMLLEKIYNMHALTFPVQTENG